MYWPTVHRKIICFSNRRDLTLSTGKPSLGDALLLVKKKTSVIIVQCPVSLITGRGMSLGVLLVIIPESVREVGKSQK